MNFFIDKDTIESSAKTIVVEDEQVHHFKNVQRGKEGDEAKVFDGAGNVYQAKTVEVKKKSLTLEVKKHQFFQKDKAELRLILGVPKKEYVESILRSATQIGLAQVILVPTKYSPYKFKMSDRYLKILKSSIVQSENPWMPEVVTLMGIEELKQIEDQIIVFSTELETNKANTINKVSHFFIGPEGGFHEDELQTLSGYENTVFRRCNTPIMKAEVAVPYCASYVRAIGATPN